MWDYRYSIDTVYKVAAPVDSGEMLNGHKYICNYQNLIVIGEVAVKANAEIANEDNFYFQTDFMDELFDRMYEDAKTDPVKYAELEAAYNYIAYDRWENHEDRWATYYDYCYKKVHEAGISGKIFEGDDFSIYWKLID